MSRIANAPTPPPAPTAAVGRLRVLARLLDEAVRVPGTGVRVGIDPLLGLIPGVGDLVGGGISSYIILLAARHGAPPSVILRMAGNVAVDTAVGFVPLLGDLFDAGWKSNTRNLRLLERHLVEPKAVRASSLAVVGVALGAVALSVALAIGAVILVGRAILN